MAVLIENPGTWKLQDSETLISLSSSDDKTE